MIQDIIQHFYERIQNKLYLLCLTQNNFTVWKQFITTREPEFEVAILSDYVEQSPSHIREDQKDDEEEKEDPYKQTCSLELCFHFEICALNHLRNASHVADLVFNREETHEERRSRFASILVCELVKKELQERHAQKTQDKLMLSLMDDLKMATKEILFLKELQKGARICEMTDDTYCSRCLATYHQADTLKREYDKLLLKNDNLRRSLNEWNDFDKIFSTEKVSKKKQTLSQRSPQKTQERISYASLPEDVYLSEIQSLKTKLKFLEESYDQEKDKYIESIRKIKAKVSKLKLKNQILVHRSKNWNQKN
jgi:hypothetical protein